MNVIGHHDVRNDFNAVMSRSEQKLIADDRTETLNGKHRTSLPGANR